MIRRFSVRDGERPRVVEEGDPILTQHRSPIPADSIVEIQKDPAERYPRRYQDQPVTEAGFESLVARYATVADSDYKSPFNFKSYGKKVEVLDVKWLYDLEGHVALQNDMPSNWRSKLIPYQVV